MKSWLHSCFPKIAAIFQRRGDYSKEHGGTVSGLYSETERTRRTFNLPPIPNSGLLQKTFQPVKEALDSVSCFNFSQHFFQLKLKIVSKQFLCFSFSIPYSNYNLFFENDRWIQWLLDNSLTFTDGRGWAWTHKVLPIGNYRAGAVIPWYKWECIRWYNSVTAFDLDDSLFDTFD